MELCVGDDLVAGGKEADKRELALRPRAGSEASKEWVDDLRGRGMVIERVEVLGGVPEGLEAVFEGRGLVIAGAGDGWAIHGDASPAGSGEGTEVAEAIEEFGFWQAPECEDEERVVDESFSDEEGEADGVLAPLLFMAAVAGWLRRIGIGWEEVKIEALEWFFDVGREFAGEEPGAIASLVGEEGDDASPLVIVVDAEGDGGGIGTVGASLDGALDNARGDGHASGLAEPGVFDAFDERVCAGAFDGFDPGAGGETAFEVGVGDGEFQAITDAARIRGALPARIASPGLVVVSA